MQAEDEQGQNEKRQDSVVDYLPTLEKEAPADVAVDAAVIWLHGLGAGSDDFAPVVRELDLSPHYGVRFIFPQAPAIPVSINNGFIMPAWYDISNTELDRHVDLGQLHESAARVQDLIQREAERGIAPKRIVVGGFSQGGAVALQAGLSYPQRLAGVMSLSGYFATADSIKVQPVQRGLPVLVCHGSMDPMVPEALGRKTTQTLEAMDLAAEYHSYPMPHAVCAEEVRDIGHWLQRVLAYPH